MYGLLFHGLSLHYRVNYGLNAQSTKQMAVPYSASDTPKAHAEYSHPNMAILYTCLSYLNKGLMEVQFLEVMLTLQNMGTSSQHAVYDEWDAIVWNDLMIKKEVQEFDDILKIHMDNTVQFNLMFQAFHCRMEVICFWINDHVFPNETFQFPKRRTMSAWNLVDTNDAIGFSGTDDNQFLLPLFVRQIPPEEKYPCVTNGEMIDCSLQCTSMVEVLDNPSSDDSPMWIIVLAKCSTSTLVL